MKVFVFLCFTVLNAALCLSSSAFRFCTDDWQCPLYCTCRYGRCDCSRWKREAPKQLDQAAVAGSSSSAAYHDGCSGDWECPWGCTCNWFGRCECRFRREEPWLLNRFAAGLTHGHQRIRQGMMMINEDNLYEPPRGKTNNLHWRKQRRRSAVQ